MPSAVTLANIEPIRFAVYLCHLLRSTQRFVNSSLLLLQFFSINPTTGALEAGIDSTSNGHLILLANGNPSRVCLQPDRFVPVSGNTIYLGDSLRRWKRVYAINGTIHTSDERLKTNIEDLDYGLD